MWRKQERPTTESATPVAARPVAKKTTAQETSRVAAGSVLVGELGGESDVAIGGRVEGSVKLDHSSVEIEPTGVVIANVVARSIRVAGEVRGDLRGSERVVLLPTARVEGDIYTKSLTLEDGAQLNGSVDMESVESSVTLARNVKTNGHAATAVGTGTATATPARNAS